MKKFLVLLLGIVMVFSFTMLTACGGGSDSDELESSAETVEDEPAASSETDDVNGAAFGYTGSDPVEAAVYQYVVEEFASSYDLPEGSVSIPIVEIIETDVDTDDGEVEVKGDFWIYNYVIEGDTLKMVSGGNYPGKIELIEVGGGYAGKGSELVTDGEGFESSARDIFEEKYDEFMKINSDAEAREALRAQTIANYVKANDLNVTKYQDEGWDPVDIPL